MLHEITSVPGAMVCATVEANGYVTHYRRAGVGRAVLLLASSDEPRLDLLAEALAEEWRVTIPASMPPSDQFGSWLLDFIDALGLEHVLVLAIDAHLADACAFAASYPDRVLHVESLDTLLREAELPIAPPSHASRARTSR